MDERTYHLINDYLEGKLIGRELDQFKARLKEPEFAKQVAIQEQIAEAIRDQRKRELKAMLTEKDGPIYIENSWGNRWTYASAAIVILFVSAFFILKNLAPDAELEFAAEDLTEAAEDQMLPLVDTLLPEDSGLMAMNEQLPQQAAAQEQPELDEYPSEEITVADLEALAMNDMPSTRMAKAVAPQSADDQEEVMTEGLIQISTYTVSILSPDFLLREADAVAKEDKDSADRNRSVGSRQLPVEFWTNPINFKGYQYTSDGKLKLYRAHESGQLSFVQLDGRLYLRMGGSYYFIAQDGEDHKFVPVTNQTLLDVLND